MGDPTFRTYINLIKAVRSRDWERAAAESWRPDVGNERNIYTAKLFLEAVNTK
jgi:hypothetical protein